MRRLFDSKIYVTSHPGGVRDTRRQQRITEIVPAVDGQVANEFFFDRLRLMCSLGFHERHFPGHFDLARQLRHLQLEIHDDGLPDGDIHALSNLGLKARQFGPHVVGRR